MFWLRFADRWPILSIVKIYTIGHSTRPLEALVNMLRAHDVDTLADIRTIPKSRRHPQFNTEALAKSLPLDGVKYVHLGALGGLRKPRADSTNLGWRNESFRGYADYMETEKFEAGLAALLDLAAHNQVAIMCAEAVPWQCHRSLVADALTARGIEVVHIMSETQANPHRMTSFAEIKGDRVRYPGEPRLL